ncbi:MAG: transporter substrate-binding domain-containing protein [Sedimenticola sp.]
MKKLFLRLLWTLLLVVTVQAAAGEQEALRVVGNHAPPYRIIEGDHFTGIYFDSMKELASRLGLKIRYIEVPYKRALYMMRFGNADIMLGPNHNPQREAYMEYTGATLPREDKVFYVHSEADTIVRYEDLSRRQILVHQGNVYFDRFDQDAGLKKLEFSQYRYAIQKAVNCTACVLIMPEMEGDYLLKELAINLKKSPFKVEGKLSYITISRRSRALALQQQIEETMAQMKADGTFDRILAHYQRGGRAGTSTSMGVEPK